MAVDLAKGLIATSVISRLFWDPTLPFYNHTPFDDLTIIQMICGGAAIIGHVWTVFAGFKGGKGIATAAGMLLGIAADKLIYESYTLGDWLRWGAWATPSAAWALSASG